jgi:hypothetical protein
VKVVSFFSNHFIRQSIFLIEASGTRERRSESVAFRHFSDGVASASNDCLRHAYFFC